VAIRGGPARPLPSGAVEGARQHVRALVARERVPGFAITVSAGPADGFAVWHQGFGFADLEARAPATPSTRFRVGSVSKVLTAVTLVRLAREGVVDLDAPIGESLPGIPQHLRGITLRQLSGHIAGVRHYRGSEYLSNTPFATLRDAVGVFANDPLLALPGTLYLYSSYGYTLIGAVLEAATGRPFPELVQAEVLDPLGMSATVPDRKGSAIPERARTYSISASGVTDAPVDDLSGRWPGGGYLSSTDDLARLGRVMLGPGLLDSTALEVLRTPQRLASGEATSVGIGWRVSRDSRGRRYLHHGGTSNGGAAFLLVYPEEKVVVAMASNAFARWGERDALAVAETILAAVEGTAPGPGAALDDEREHVGPKARSLTGRAAGYGMGVFMSIWISAALSARL
jgi:CubicO group peptidase (beta-lactamase class C family)